MERLIIEEELNERIDSYLSKNTDYSRSKIVKMLESGTILVNDKTVKNSYTLKIGDIMYYTKLFLLYSLYTKIKRW